MILYSRISITITSVEFKYSTIKTKDIVFLFGDYLFSWLWLELFHHIFVK